MSQSKAKIATGSKARHTLYLKKNLVEDSSFPFKVGEPLIVKIEGDRLVIEKDR